MRRRTFEFLEVVPPFAALASRHEAPGGTHRGILAEQPSPDDAVNSALARAGAAGADDLRPGGLSDRPAVAGVRRRDPSSDAQGPSGMHSPFWKSV